MSHTELVLTWPQITWAIGVLIVLISGWFDLRVRQKNSETRLQAIEELLRGNFYTRGEIDTLKEAAQRERERLEQRVSVLESAIIRVGKLRAE